MKAISIHQPWAEAIVGFGADIDNRIWPTDFRGAVLIQAQEWDDEPGFATVRRILEGLGRYPCQGIDPRSLRRGGIVGRCEIVDCVTSSPSPWFRGPYGFVLRNVRPLIFREQQRGIGFFDVDAAALDLTEPPEPDLLAGVA